MLNVMLTGVGGQGTVLAAKVLAQAAQEKGWHVRTAETIGMAQRGGSVTSHVRIGGEAFSPLIPFGGADMLLAFEPGEAVRNLRYLKKGGIAVVNTSAVKPVTESLKETGYDGSEMTAYLKEKCSCIFVNAEEVCRPFGSTKFFNIIMLGVAAGSGHLGLEKDTLLKQIEQRVPSRFLDVNLRAFQTGIEIAGQAVR